MFFKVLRFILGYRTCPECCGRGSYYNSYDTRDCGCCGTKGYIRRENYFGKY